MRSALLLSSLPGAKGKVVTVLWNVVKREREREKKKVEKRASELAEEKELSAKASANKVRNQF